MSHVGKVLMWVLKPCGARAPLCQYSGEPSRSRRTMPSSVLRVRIPRAGHLREGLGREDLPGCQRAVESRQLCSGGEGIPGGTNPARGIRG